MNCISLRAALTAICLSTATLTAASLALTQTASAAVRPAVGKPLKAAVAAAAAGNYAAARAQVEAAESAGGLTADDRAAIAQVRNYIAQKSGTGGGKGGLTADYLAGHYSAVIAAGRKGGLDAQSMQLVAQAYYLTHDYRSCTSFIQTHFGSGASEQLLELQMRCAYEAQDNVAMRGALEQLVARTNKPEYWTQLLSTAEGTKGLRDHQTLDIYRIKFLTGTLVKADDYMLLAQLGLQLGFAAEAQNIVQKGIDAKVLTGDRVNRLLKLAQTQTATNAANYQKALAAANAASSGDGLIKLGEDAWGQNKFDDAVKLVQAGLAKGTTDEANGQLRLGMAYLGLKQKDQAIRTFVKADGSDQNKVIARLWEIFARTH